ncbi:MAG: ribose 5-phosphate isomerase B [FCB group bacterium]|nr:ribose 5-phosphate isomerase B [FCB group bacterium]
MKIALASDHAGYKIKEVIKKFLSGTEHQVQDFGTFSEESMDYPDTAHPAAHSVADGNNDTGILICGSGQGMQLTANRYPGIRAALCWSPEIAGLARQHNNANILAIPGRFVEGDTAIAIVEIWLKTNFEGGRHQRRIDKIKLD